MNTWLNAGQRQKGLWSMIMNDEDSRQSNNQSDPDRRYAEEFYQGFDSLLWEAMIAVATQNIVVMQPPPKSSVFEVCLAFWGAHKDQVGF